MSSPLTGAPTPTSTGPPPKITQAVPMAQMMVTLGELLFATLGVAPGTSTPMFPTMVQLLIIFQMKPPINIPIIHISIPMLRNNINLQSNIILSIMIITPPRMRISPHLMLAPIPKPALLARGPTIIIVAVTNQRPRPMLLLWTINFLIKARETSKGDCTYAR